MSAGRPTPDSAPAPQRRSAAALGLMVLVLAIAASGCPCLRGPVNASPALRWWLFSNFGASKICPEMLKRGVGLKMQDRGPTIGRFFPTGCMVDVNDAAKTATVSFSGTGYATMPVTRRVGFRASASVEYRPDFYLAEDDVYVWGQVNRLVFGPKFELGYVENPVADVATAVTPLGALANVFGNQIVASELTRGFTVVQSWDTDSKTFALGILRPPQKPHTPYDVDRDELYTFANETVEVQYNQRDYLGPFEVVEAGERLAMTYHLQGPSVDVMVVDKATGDRWREDYQLGRPLGPPPGPVVAGGPLQAGRELRVAYSLRPGQYYVVIDHTQYAGVVRPPGASLLNPMGGPAARISYVAQLRGD